MPQAHVYRPACFLRIQVRLEDFDDDLDPDAETEAKPYAERLKAVTNDLSRAEDAAKRAAVAHSQGGYDWAAMQDTNARVAQLRADQARLSRKAALAAEAPSALADEFSVSMYTVPVDLSLELNGFRMADTITASFPFTDAPLMSEVIRAALVEVWMGTIAEEDFANVERWRLDTKRQTAHLMFRGYVDNWETVHNEADATVSIQARSFEAILIDAKISPLAKAYRINGSGEKITAYVNRILEQLPATSGKSGLGQFRAIWFGADPDKEPVLDRKLLNRSLQTAQSRNEASGATSNMQAVQEDQATSGATDPAASEGPPQAQGDPRMAPKAPGHEMSVWDLITQACEIAGCLPVYDPVLDPDHLLLRPPQTIYGDVLDGYRLPEAPPDDFERELVLSSGKRVKSQVRFMVWGHNIKTFKTARKLGRIKLLGVEVTSYNEDAPANERLISVQFPEKKKVTRRSAKGDAPTNEIKTIRVKGIRNKEELKQIAVGVYHSMCRQELSVQLETNDMSSYIDPSTGIVHNENPDLLTLRPGAPCRVTVARQLKEPARIVISPLSEIFEARGEELRRLLTEQRGRFKPEALGLSAADVDTTVRRIADAISSAKLSDLFYCRSVTHKFSANEGWQAALELVNYLSARGVVRDTQDRQVEDQRKPVKRATTAADKNKKATTEAVDRLRNRTRT